MSLFGLQLRLVAILWHLSPVTTQFGDDESSGILLENNNSIKILGMFPYVPPDVYSEEYVSGHVLQASVEIALEDIAKTDDLLNGYSLDLQAVDSRCDQGDSAFHFAEKALRPNRPVIILGPKCNDPTRLIANMVNPDNSVISVSYGARTITLNSADKRFFRTVAPNSELNKAVYGLLSNFKWERICILVQSKNTADEYLRQAEHFTSYLSEKSMNFTILHIVTEQNPEFVADSYCRIFVIFAKSWVHPWVSCELQLLNLTGEYFISLFVGFFMENVPQSMIPCLLNLNDSARSSFSIHFGESFLFTDSDPPANGETDYPHMKHGRDFENELLARIWPLYLESQDTSLYYYTPEVVAAAYDATWAIALALNASIESLALENLTLKNYLPLSASHVSDLIIEQFESLSFQGVYKMVNFTNERHYLYENIIISQFQDGSFKPIATYDSRTEELSKLENESFVWIGENVPSDRPFVIVVDSIEFLALALIPFCGLILCLIFFAFNCYFRNRNVIKASSPHINNIVILGCAIIFLSIASYILDGSTALNEITRTCLCNLTLWFVFCGFTLSLGSLAVKTWRVYRIFRNPWSLQRRLYKDSSLYVILAVMLGIDVFFLLLMSAIAPLHSSEFAIETPQYTYIYLTCQASTYSEIFSYTLIMYKVLVLAVAGFLALQTRKIKSKVFNDSKWIAITIYLVVFSTMLGLPVALISIFSGKFTLSFVSIVILLALIGYNILLTVFVPKIFALRQAQKELNMQLVVTSANHPETKYHGRRRTSEYYRPSRTSMMKTESTADTLMTPPIPESDE